jgi:hypothetical protein
MAAMQKWRQGMQRAKFLSIKPLEHQGVGANEAICINVNEFPNEKKVYIKAALNH